MPCTLEYTDERFVYAFKPYPDIPLLVDGDFHFVRPVCSYFANLIIKENLGIRSVKTYAQYIQSFWNYLEIRKIDYNEVIDKDLLGWLNKMELKGTKSYVRAQRCDAVFSLYYWLEIKGYVKDSIRIPGHNDDHKFSPRLSSRKSKPSKHRASRNGLVSGVRPRGSSSDAIQYTPDAQDMTKLYIAADKASTVDLVDRNHLIIDWAAHVGLRRIEITNLTIQQIPTWAVIDDLRSRNHVFDLRLIITKGGRARLVQIIPRLLEKTLEYIEGPRATIVERFKKKYGREYIVPNQIFLSTKTGKAITATPVTNLLGSYFKAANIPSHGHRIRAYHLQALLEAEVSAAVVVLLENNLSPKDIDWEKIVRKVAERAGHSDLQSIWKYVTILKKRWARDAGRDDYVSVVQQLAALKQELAIHELRAIEMKSSQQNKT